MIETLLALPPQTRRRLAHGLTSGALSLKPTEMALRSTTGITGQAETLLAALSSLESRGMTGPSAAILLEALCAAEAKHYKPDLVWSGPQALGVPARGTKQVYEELINGAKQSLWLSSYVYFDGPNAFAVLAQRMSCTPGLRVRLLLNIERQRGDTSESGAVVARFAQKFWQQDWPGEANPEVYYARSSVNQAERGGALHAKVIVADDERLFITSANLTRAAFEQNIEAGMLARDPVLALSVVRHFSGLIDCGFLKRLPDRQ